MGFRVNRTQQSPASTNGTIKTNPRFPAPALASGNLNALKWPQSFLLGAITP